eukprot:6207689-Pleurochrysis_carterae.AAC.1
MHLLRPLVLVVDFGNAQALADYARVLELDPQNESAVDGIRQSSARDGTRSGGSGAPGQQQTAGRQPNLDKDAYELLEVSRDASSAQVKHAFRRKAMLWHPDRHVESDEAMKAKAEEQFKLVSLAYSILSDPVKRRKHNVGASMQDLAGA